MQTLTEVGGISRICLIMKDGTIDEVVPRHHADAEDLQSRTDNLYRGEQEDIDTVIAYDWLGDKMGAITSEEFFVKRLGF